MKILVLAAMPEEAAAFLPGQGAPLEAGWDGARRIDALGHDIVVATCGVGKVNIAVAATRLHALHGADLLCITGTAGKLSTLEGNCFWLARAVQHDYGARKPDAFVHYDPGAYPLGPASITPVPAMADPGLGLPHACIVSGDCFVEDAAFARHLIAALDGDVVDMETAALAQVARLLDIPWCGIKAVTDDANHESAGDFHANLRAAARRAAEALERLIALL